MENTTSTMDKKIHVTPTAVQEIKRLMALEKSINLFLRLGVISGGCSGMSYAMQFDSNRDEQDVDFDFDGLQVVVDSDSLAYINGSTLDYKGGLMEGGFVFDNPNARRSCGCGSSFKC